MLGTDPSRRVTLIVASTRSPRFLAVKTAQGACGLD